MASEPPIPLALDLPEGTVLRTNMGTLVRIWRRAPLGFLVEHYCAGHHAQAIICHIGFDGRFANSHTWRWIVALHQPGDPDPVSVDPVLRPA